MAEVLPEITVTDHQARDGGVNTGSLAPSPTFDGVNGWKDGKPKSSELWSTSTGKSFPNKIIRNLSSNHAHSSGQSIGPEAKRDSPTAIDPLSQLIFERTHPENMISPKARAGDSSEGEPGFPEKVASIASARTTSEAPIARSDTVSSVTRDKKKGASFLSRFIASKKKDIPAGSNVEIEDKKPDALEADVFSQPIGFIPRFPAPPKYIKTRVQGKKERDFGRVFLAQELRGRTGVEIAQAGGRPAKQGPINPADMTKDGNAIWAMEFSKDGKYLAAAGHDHVVRIWAVIATEEDRQATEGEEVAASKDGQRMRLNAPIFKTKPEQEYEAHTASVLDLSWSKNNFLLSSSMDKTVRLWHISRDECLCCFKHSDFVTSIQFHPRDDRFFLAGSLDSKLRLWSIPDKSVAFWSQLPDLITAVAFAPDGKTAIAGCLHGLCLFYETEGLKYQTQIHVRSAHGKNAKGSKITGIQAINYPPEDPNGEVKLLVTSNDSRVRVYNLRDKGLEMKLKGNENICSQIHATFSDDARYVICGSEDKKAYIWSTGRPEAEKDKRPLEIFENHTAIVTTAIMAPTKTRQILGASGDPLYELCNPPPVTLISKTDSHSSSRPPTENGQNPIGSVPPTPGTAEGPKIAKPEESPAYIARSAHQDGNIIVTADYMGRIRVFRQDCAYKQRLRNENWDTTSTFSKKMLNRSNSVATRSSSNKSKRESLTHSSSDHILSWRQSIQRNNGSHDNVGPSPHNHRTHRSVSPRKSSSQMSTQSNNTTPRHHSQPLNATAPSITKTSDPPKVQQWSVDSAAQHSRGNVSKATKGKEDNITPKPYTAIPMREGDPLMLQGDQSYMFWNKAAYQETARTWKNNLRLADPSLLHQNNGVGHHGGRGRNDSLDGGSSNGSFSAVGTADSTDPYLGGDMGRRLSTLSAVSALSSEVEDSSDGGAGGKGDRDGAGEGGEVRCRRCGSGVFKARVVAGGGRRLECGACGSLV